MTNHRFEGIEEPPDRTLTPEEDSIGEPDGLDDEIDDLMPADLWF